MQKYIPKTTRILLQMSPKNAATRIRTIKNTIVNDKIITDESNWIPSQSQDPIIPSKTQDPVMNDTVTEIEEDDCALHAMLKLGHHSFGNNNENIISAEDAHEEDTTMITCTEINDGMDDLMME